MDIVDAAVRPDDPELGIEVFFATQRQLALGVPALSVIRVDSRLPCVVGPAEGVRGDAVEEEHLVVPDQPVVDHVVLPDADAASPSGKHQALAGQAQFFECLPALCDIGK